MSEHYAPGDHYYLNLGNGRRSSGDVADKIDELVPEASIPIEAHCETCRQIIDLVRQHDSSEQDRNETMEDRNNIINTEVLDYWGIGLYRGWHVEVEPAGVFRWRVTWQNRLPLGVGREGFGPVVVWGTHARAWRVAHRWVDIFNGV